mgnify:CR=1 FL=1
MYTGGSAEALGSLLDPLLDELPTPAEAAQWGSPTVNVVGVAIAVVELLGNPSVTTPNGKLVEEGLKFASASLLLLPAQADSEHEVILNALACPEAELFAAGVEHEAEPEAEGELVANGVRALAVDTVAGREGVVLTMGEAAEVDVELRGETKKYAAGEAIGNDGPVFVNVGGRKVPIGSDDDKGVLDNGAVGRVAGLAIIAGVCGTGPARDHGEGVLKPLILASTRDQARWCFSCACRAERIHASGRT